MDLLKKVMKKILFPGKAIMISLAIVSAVMLTCIFAFDFKYNAIAHLSYVVSAYTMIVLCLVVYRQVKKSIVMVEGKNEYVNRYLNDLSFRTHVSLYLSLTINVVYAVVKFFSGFIIIPFGLAASPSTISVWPSCVSCCLRHAHKNAFGKDLVGEYKKYRICGAVLVVLNLALTGMVILIVVKNYTYSYPGTMIYAMGAFALL